MITNEVMTPMADAAAQRYGMMVDTWRGLFRQEIDARGFGTARSFTDTHVQAYEISRVYLNTEKELIHAAFDQIARDAHTDALMQIGADYGDELPEPATELLSELRQYLALEIIIQSERDVAYLVQSLRQAAFQIDLAARAQGISRQAALMQYRIGDASPLQFFFRDRGNQKWPSRKFIRAIWRQTLLSIYNEVMLLTLAEHGIDTAEVVSLNPSSHAHGMVLAMSSQSSLPTYAEVRNEIFHPNADAVLAAPEAA